MNQRDEVIKLVKKIIDDEEYREIWVLPYRIESRTLRDKVDGWVTFCENTGLSDLMTTEYVFGKLKRST